MLWSADVNILGAGCKKARHKYSDVETLMGWIELIGYGASFLVLLTFCMRTMIPLRIVAISSNAAFIAYGAFDPIYPVLVLHTILLPLNIYRTREMLRLVRRVKEAARGDLSIDWLRPFMKAQKYEVGEKIFQKGDRADRLYFIVSGEVVLDEFGERIGPGHLFGEIGLFSPEHQRTLSVSSGTSTELLWVNEDELVQMCYQNPGMAFHLLRLITRRLSQDASRIGVFAAAHPAS